MCRPLISSAWPEVVGLLRATAEARLRRAELWAVLAWGTPRRGTRGRYSAHVSAVAQCRATAGDRLREALDAAFGPGRPEVTVQGITVWGEHPSLNGSDGFARADGMCTRWECGAAPHR